MDVWTGFYKKLFNFRQIRFFDIEGRASGLFSRALTSPDGKIRIPINEDAGDSGQIEEYLSVYRGEGNFNALFESIEEDQIRRGVLTVGDKTAA